MIESAQAAFQPKLIYLARRNAALARTQFVERWRRHGALGMAQPRWRNIARYVHCDVLHPYSARTKSLSDEYDGVGIVWHRSPEARLAHLADTTSRTTMERDELETFAEPVVNFCRVTRESMLQRPDAANPGVVKLIRFVRARDRTQALGLAPFFIRHGVTVRAQLQAAGAAPCGQVVNEPLWSEASSQTDRRGLDADCIEELWFASAQAALKAADFLAGDGGQTTVPPVLAFDSITVMTNEVVLYSI